MLLLLQGGKGHVGRMVATWLQVLFPCCFLTPPPQLHDESIQHHPQKKAHKDPKVLSRGPGYRLGTSTPPNPVFHRSTDQQALTIHALNGQNGNPVLHDQQVASQGGNVIGDTVRVATEQRLAKKKEALQPKSKLFQKATTGSTAATSHTRTASPTLQVSDHGGYIPWWFIRLLHIVIVAS